MIIAHYNQGLIKFSPETKRDKEILRTFPGGLDIGLEKYSVSKQHVVYNIIQRLKAKNLSLTISEDVERLLRSEFKLLQLPDSFRFITEPLKHQLVALRFLYTVKCAGLLLEAGMGKTKVILDYIALMNFTRSIIIAPKALLFVWEDECAVHRPDKKVYVVKSTNWEDEITGILNSDITVMNYSKAVILQEELKQISWDYINLDEFLIKDPFSQRTLSITDFSKKIPYKTGASGTLVNNTPLDVFAPVKFLEPSLTGNSFTKFKEEYAITKKVNRDETSSARFIVGYRRVPEIKSILHSCSIVMTKEE